MASTEDRMINIAMQSPAPRRTQQSRAERSSSVAGARTPLMVAACIAVAIAAAGCPGCGSQAATFCIEAAKVQCQLQFRCCTAQERSALFGNTNLAIGPYHDEGGCVDAFTAVRTALGG